MNLTKQIAEIRNSTPHPLVDSSNVAHDNKVMNVGASNQQNTAQILSPDYLKDIVDLPLEVVRERRDKAAQAETDLSYFRRLLHARIDIVQAEQHRRSNGSTSNIIEQLPAILADNALAPAHGAGRHQQLEPSTTGVTEQQIAALMSNSDTTDMRNLTETALEAMAKGYRATELAISAQRRAIQQVVDTCNAEIARRYAYGTASVDELLDRERTQ